MLSPGASCWPSASGLDTEKGDVGGAALVTVWVRLPSSVIVKVCVADWPTWTLPKLSDVGLIVTWGLATMAWPVSGMVTEPWSLVRTIDELSDSAAVGA